MGKSRKRKRAQGESKPKKAQAVWGEKEILELHAYLDYAVGKDPKPRPVEIDEELLQHLFRQCNRQYDLALLKLELGILFMWSKRDDGLTKDDVHLVYEYGSCVLTYYKPEFRENELRKRVEEIKAEKREDLIHSGRKLRSVSRTPGTNDRRLTPFRSKRARDASRFLTESDNNGLRASQSSLGEQAGVGGRWARSPETPTPAIKAELDTPPSSSTVSFQSASATNDELQVSTPAHEGGASDSIPETPSYAPSFPVQKSPDNVQADSAAYTDRVPLQVHLKQLDSLRQRNAILEERLGQEATILQESQYWEKAFADLTAECHTLQDRYDNLKLRSHLALGPQGDAALEEVLLNDERVAKLEEKVLQLVNARGSELDQAERPRIDLGDIATRHQIMSSSLDTVFNSQAFIACGSRIHVDTGSELFALSERAGVLDDCESAQLNLTETPQLISQALVAAALSLWVFEVDVRNLFPGLGLGTPSKGVGRLFQKYRAILEKRDVRLSRHVDFTAHQELLEDQFFQEFLLSQQARLLTQRAIGALMPLFRQTDLACDHSGHSSVVSESDKDRLMDAFTQAMRIRCDILMSEYKFAYSFYPKGTLFCPKSMAQAQESIIQARVDGAAVSMTLLHGLQRGRLRGQPLDYRPLTCVEGGVPAEMVQFVAAKVLLRKQV